MQKQKKNKMFYGKFVSDFHEIGKTRKLLKKYLSKPYENKKNEEQNNCNKK